MIFNANNAVGSIPLPAESGTSSPRTDHRLQEAGRQFETIFLRQILSSLERTAQVQRGSGLSSGGLYGSMLVDAVADAVSRAGGIGLGKLLAESVAAKASAPTLTHTEPVHCTTGGRTKLSDSTK
jgi:flagellar protein FlgJ